MAIWAGSSWARLAFWGSRAWIHWGLRLNTTQWAWPPFASVTFSTTHPCCQCELQCTHFQFLPLPVTAHHDSLISKVIFGVGIMQERALFLLPLPRDRTVKHFSVKQVFPESEKSLPTVHTLEFCYRSMAGFATGENITKLLNSDSVKVSCSYAREVWEMPDLFWRTFWMS